MLYISSYTFPFSSLISSDMPLVHLDYKLVHTRYKINIDKIGIYSVSEMQNQYKCNKK